MSAEAVDFEAIRSDLAERYPERCRRYGLCGSLGVQVAHWTISVAIGEVSLEEAQETINADAVQVARDCSYGQALELGDPPSPRCRRGVLCEFPAQ